MLLGRVSGRGFLSLHLCKPCLIPASPISHDSPLEGTGFEPLVPLFVKGLSAVADKRCRTDKLDGVIKHRSFLKTTMVGRGASLDGRLILGGTDGSNPVPSSEESSANSVPDSAEYSGRHKPQVCE